MASETWLLTGGAGYIGSHMALRLDDDGENVVILDNLTDVVKPWEETGYRYLKRQASYHTGRWVSILSDQNTLVGAVN